MIFTTNKQFWDYLSCELSKKNFKNILISTYNLKSGINNWKYNNGKPRPGLPYILNPIQKILNLINIKSGIIIIGQIKPFNEEYDRIKSLWPDIEFRYKYNHHAKCVIVNYGSNKDVWVGSSNCSDSKWSDLTVKINNRTDIININTKFNQWLSESKLIDNKLLDSLDD